MRSESAEFHVLWRTCTQGNDFLSLSLNFDAVFQNSTVLDRFEKEVFFFVMHNVSKCCLRRE